MTNEQMKFLAPEFDWRNKQPYTAEMTELRAQLRRRALRELYEQSSIDPEKVAAAVVKDLPVVVAGGLAQIVSDEIERFNDEEDLERRGQGTECEGARCLSATLGVPASHLIHLDEKDEDEKQWEEWCDANDLIISLRGSALQAHADGRARACHA